MKPPQYTRIKTKYPGVFSRETDKGKIFYIRYRRPGNRNLIEDRLIGKHWTPARAAQERGRRIDGEPSNREKRQTDEAERISRLHRPNLENLFNRYLADKADERGRPLKSENKLQKSFKKHFKHIKDKTPDELAETDVLRIRRDILKNNGKLKTVSNVIGILNTIIKHGIKHRVCGPIDFELPIPKNREINNKTTERFSPAELASFLKALEEEPQQIRNYYLMALHTGMRKNEICKLVWSDCNFDYMELLIRDAKSGHDEKIPISASMKKILDKQFQIKHLRNPEAASKDMIFFSKTGCVLGPSDKIFTQTSARIRERAGLPKNFRMVHGLRHVFGTLHAVAGTPALLLKELMTHKDLNTTLRYIEIASNEAKHASDKTGEIIDKHIKGDYSPNANVVNLTS